MKQSGTQIKAVIFSIFALLGCCLLTTDLSAQLDSNAKNAMPAAPENQVLDQADVFREQPQKLAKLTSTLARIKEKHDYKVYLAVYYNILDGTVQGRADELYGAWLEDEERGLVIVVQRDPAVNGQNVAASYFQGSGLEKDTESGLIPDREMNSIIRSALAEKSESDEIGDRCITLVQGVDQHMGEYFAIDPAKWSDAGNLKMMAVFFGVIALLAIGGSFIWKHFNAAEVKSQQHFIFPMVDVAQRLGAPYGGGWGSEKSFQPSSSSRR